jgi:hypothetical protein
MKKKTKYTDELLKMGERVPDFLPPLSRLVKRERVIHDNKERVIPAKAGIQRPVSAGHKSQKV